MTDDTPPAGDVTLSVRISAPPDAIFDHLVEPDKLMAWMGVEADVEPWEGGLFRLNVTGADTAVGTYLVVDRPRQVSFTWGWEDSPHVPPGSSTVSIDLTEDGGDTVVTLIHRGLPGGSDDEHRIGWVHYLDRLTVVAEGGDPGVDPNTRSKDS